MKKEHADGKQWDDAISKILTAYNAVSRSINPTQLLKVDLTSSQIKVLVGFFERDSYTMTELSKTHSVSVSTMTSMVDRLLQSGLIERQRDEVDRRVVRVSLSREGKKMVKYLMQVRRGELEKFLHELTPEEVELFVTSIETVAQYLTMAKERVYNK
jgi:DNA-binding MarR family transcriptional regulator